MAESFCVAAGAGAVGRGPRCPSPGEWYAEVVAPVVEHGPDDDADPAGGSDGEPAAAPAGSPAGGPTWVGVAELLGDGPHGLAALHRRLCARMPAPAAATYLVGWYAGPLANVVGLGLATAGVAVAVPPDTIRWRVGTEGWPDRVRLDPLRVGVAPEHPWASLASGHTGDPASGAAGGAVEVLADATPDEVAARAVDGLVATVGPLVSLARALAPVGRVGLWNEVGDDLALGLAYADHLEVTGSMIDTALAATARPGAPWRAHPRLWLVDTAHGSTCVGQKGGCCLAYTVPGRDRTPATDDPDVLEFLARFPVEPGVPRYCGNCSFRDPEEAAARQVFWFERRQAGGTG